MNNRKLAFVWIAVVIIMLFFGWLIVKASDPPSDSTKVELKTKKKKTSSYDPIREVMNEQQMVLDSLIMKKKSRLDTIN